MSDELYGIVKTIKNCSLEEAKTDLSNEDGTLKENALEIIQDAFAARIENETQQIKLKSKEVAENQYKRGVKEQHSKFKPFLEKFNFHELQGDELFEKLNVYELPKPIEFDETKITDDIFYNDERYKNAAETLYKEEREELATLKQQAAQRQQAEELERSFAPVKAQLSTLLKEANVVERKGELAIRDMDFYLKDLKQYTYKEGLVYKDGEVLKDAHFNPIKQGNFLLAVAKNHFEFAVQGGKGSAGFKPDGGGGTSVHAPKDLKELEAILANPNIPAVEKNQARDFLNSKK